MWFDQATLPDFIEIRIYIVRRQMTTVVLSNTIGRMLGSSCCLDAFLPVTFCKVMPRDEPSILASVVRKTRPGD